MSKQTAPTTVTVRRRRALADLGCLNVQRLRDNAARGSCGGENGNRDGGGEQVAERGIKRKHKPLCRDNSYSFDFSKPPPDHIGRDVPTVKFIGIVTPEDIARAGARARAMGQLRNSIRKGCGNLPGFIGEEVMMRALRTCIPALREKNCPRRHV